VEVILRAVTTVTLNGLVAVWLEVSVTLAVKLEVPAVVGVPEIAPVAGVSDSPAGKLPTSRLQV
jgi:hypothetical protein